MTSKSIDLSEFEEQNGSPGNRCQWSRLMASLTDEQRKKLNAAMNSQEIQHTAIKRVLDKWGISTSKDSVARHRNNSCTTCSRKEAQNA